MQSATSHKESAALQLLCYIQSTTSHTFSWLRHTYAVDHAIHMQSVTITHMQLAMSHTCSRLCHTHAVGTLLCSRPHYTLEESATTHKCCGPCHTHESCPCHHLHITHMQLAMSHTRVAHVTHAVGLVATLECLELTIYL